jgi:acyl carrier protein
MTNTAAERTTTDPADETPDEAAAVRHEVTTFLSRYVDDTSLLERDRLISGGLLDSLAAVELIGHLERRFGVEVLDEDLDIEHFDSVAAVVAFVLRKRLP